MRTSSSAAIATAVALLVTLAGVASAGERISASLSEPVVVNGRTFAADDIHVTEIGDYGPGTTLHEVRVGTQWTGMAMARPAEGAPDEGATSLVFGRRADGTLVLEGVARRGEPTRRFLSFRSVDGRGEWVTTAALR